MEERRVSAPPVTSAPHRLHDYPLPDGYGNAAEEAARRLGHRWQNVRCPDCGTYGWNPGTSRYKLTPIKKEENK